MFPLTTLDIKLEAAFGADLSSPNSWVYTDLSDRLLAQGTGITRGRSDEGGIPQPASFTITLDNADGALTPLNNGSPYYPNVRRGIPLRVSIPGGRTGLRLPGKDGSYASTPDHASLDIAGDIDLRVRVQPDRWSADVNQRLIAKWDFGANQMSYLFSIAALAVPGGFGGLLALNWSTNGSTFVSAISSLNVTYTKPVWLGATLDVDDGSGNHVATFYQSYNTVPPVNVTDWEVVDTITQAGTTSIFAGTAPVEVGTRNLGLAGYAGYIYNAQIRDGINGTLAASPDFSAQSLGATSFADSESKTWTINGDAEISDSHIRLVCSVDEIAPYWPYGDNNAAAPSVASEARVTITASGILRRLAQGAKPLRSTLYRGITSSSNLPLLYGYWSCEDGSSANKFGSDIPDQPSNLTVDAGIETAADDSFPASGPLPTIKAGETGSWSASVPIIGGTDWEAWMAFNIEAWPTSPTRTQLFELQTGGTGARWIFDISSSDIRYRILDSDDSTIVDTTLGITDDSDTWMHFRVYAQEVGANVEWGFDLLNIDTGAFALWSSSFAGSGGPVLSVSNSTTGPSPGGMSFGHVAVTQYGRGITWLQGHDTAWVGESAAHRFWRLCVEESVPVEIIGDQTIWLWARGNLSLSEAMGPQRRNTFLDLLRECVDVDLGMMIERRRSPGLVFRTRQNLEAQSIVGLRLDASNNQIDNPFNPILDDQRLRNDITVSTVGGSSARATDATSIAEEGLYEVEETIVGVGGLGIQSAILAGNLELQDAVDNQNTIQAARRLHIATWPTMRYPVVTFDLGTASSLITDWQDVELGDMVQVVGLPAQHPPETVELLLEQISEQISNVSWRPSLTCSPGGPWLNPYVPEVVLTPPQSRFYGIDYRPAAPTPLRTVSSTTSSFATDISSALPGDRIELASGNYGEWDILGSGLNGTAANPIVITPAAGATVTFTEIDIRENCSHVWFGQFQGESQHTNFVINRGGAGGGGGACLRVGWDQQRSGSHAQNSVGNLKFCGIHVTNVSYNPMVIKGGSTDIDVINCRFSLGGRTEPQFGEHIYIGQSNGSTYPSPNERILIRGNLFDNPTSDAVDIKMSNLQDIQIVDNYFNVATLDGTTTAFINGVIGITQLQSVQVRDPQIKVTHNVIRDVSTSGSNALARGITTYMPGEYAYNVIFRTGRAAIRCNQNATLPGWWTTAIKFNLHNNTVFYTDQDNNPEDAITFASFDTADAARLRYVANITDSTVTTPSGTAEESNNHVAIAADFIGPLTGSASAGSHVGSGYTLAETSSIPATAGALGKGSAGGGSAVTVVASAELAYNSGVTFTVPSIEDGDILLVAMSQAGGSGQGDPGAPSASIPAGALTTIYSDWPGAQDFEPRQTLFGRSLVKSTDEGDTCTITPGVGQHSIGWAVIRGLSGLPGSKVQANNPTVQNGIIFPSISASTNDILFLQGSDQETVSTAADASTLDITVNEILNQMGNNRGNWFAMYEVPAGGSIDPGTLSKIGGGSYKNWVGTITLATPS